MKKFEEGDRYVYPLTPNSNVINVGGYMGDWANEINKLYGSRVFVFEPVDEFYRKLITRLDGRPNIHVFHCAIGAKDGDITIFVKGSMSGKYTSDGNSTQPSRMISIDSIMGMDWFRNGCDLMMLNCEGSEFDIIESLVQSGLIREIKNLQVQWHSVVPDCEKRWAYLQGRLTETHVLTWGDGWIWQNWERRT